MSQVKYNTEKRRFKHLTIKERSQIEILLKLGMSKSQIAREVGIARSTLYEELNRGTVTQLDGEYRFYECYYADSGQRVYEEHRSASRNPLKVSKAADFLCYAEECMLTKGYSPDAICGEVRRTGLFAQTVCTKTLYNYIDQNLLRVRNIDLPMRCKRNTKRTRKETTMRQYGTSIEQRPAEVLLREEFGHWEIDTVAGAKDNGGVLLTLDERKTRMRFMTKIPSQTADAVRLGLNEIILREKLPLSVFKSITSDNGCEFAHLSSDFPSIPIFYAHPYSAYERGTNENQNGLLRRFFPKGRSLQHVSNEAVILAQRWLNSIPRKLFLYLSASALFASALSQPNCPI